MKSLSSKSILDRVKRIEKKYMKNSQDVDKFVKDEFKLDEHYLGLDAGKEYIIGLMKSIGKDNHSIMKSNADCEQNSNEKLSRIADIQPSQSINQLLRMSECPSENGPRCTSDDSEMMLKHCDNTVTQNLNHKYFMKKQRHISCNKSSNKLSFSSLIRCRDHISTSKQHNQVNKYHIHNGKINMNVSVPSPKVKHDLKLGKEEVNDEEIKISSERSETSHSNSLNDLHLNIFPFESLVSERRLEFKNEEKINLYNGHKNFTDVHFSPEKSSSISSAKEIVPSSNSLTTPSKYSAGENSVSELDDGNFQDLNCNVFSIGDLMEDIECEPGFKEKEQSNEIESVKSLSLGSELDEAVNIDHTFKSTKISSHMNSLVKDKSDNLPISEELNEDVGSSMSSSLTEAPFIQLARDDSKINTKSIPDFQITVGGPTERQTCLSEIKFFCNSGNTNSENCIEGAENSQEMYNLIISQKRANMEQEMNSNDDTTINEDIVEETDNTANVIGFEENSEKREYVKYSKQNFVESLTNEVESRESVSQHQGEEREKRDTLVQNTSRKLNGNVKLESYESFVQDNDSKKLHYSNFQFTNLPVINATGHHVSCQTSPPLFNEFDKKIEEILKSSLPLSANLANNTQNTGPKYRDDTSSGLYSPLERGFHWALNQQVELTKHFIQSEYNMYTTCMSAIRELSSNYKPLSIRRHKKKKK